MKSENTKSGSYYWRNILVLTEVESRAAVLLTAAAPCK